VVIVAAVVVAVATPVVRRETDVASSRSEGLAELEARKEAKYREIRDAQSDLRAGKLSPEDHRDLDRVLRREAIEILEAIDQEGGTRPTG
jgi:hypothetical protein